MALGWVGWLMCGCGAQHEAHAQEQSLAPPEVGAAQVRVLTPTMLEVERITIKETDPAEPKPWNWVHGDFELEAPAADTIEVIVNGSRVEVADAGFKRRARYAPERRRHLRLGNWLYLRLKEPIPVGATVEVADPGTGDRLKVTAAKDRSSPVIHASQIGYGVGLPKTAMVGYYLGNLGELNIGEASEGPLKFNVVRQKDGEVMYEGDLQRRRDIGFTFDTYQEVWEADFTEFNDPGRYVIEVEGLGRGHPFWVHEGIPAAFTRAYALGLYHQRCGASNSLPFTRFTHEACHTAPASIPTDGFEATEAFLKDMSSNAASEERHTAPQLEGVSASLYPFKKSGKVDVSGGHHDAGDYSKYTINSAGLIHHLMFAVDAFPGVSELDNLGLPESGDGIGDMMQEALWEADFLAKMQDSDGGFYFLVYPKERKYENDVLPDAGDPQVVFPKTTSVTAAAAAALAQTASSPVFKKQYPEKAARYLEQAKRGWEFLERAIEKHGSDGSYQKITHYGHEFLHDDELAWAAVELYLATGEEKYHQFVLEKFDPADRETRRWTWWRMFESYGSAIRSYAFAERTGRLKSGQLDREFLEKCEEEILLTARDQTRFASESAYGTSFPDPSKRFRNAGWYFSIDRAFDIAVGMQLTPGKSPERESFLRGLASNMNYEAGCNPVNVCYLTGWGWKRPVEIVHQYAQNDRRVLPPSGMPIGNLQAGFQFLHHYQKELGTVSYPPDGAEADPYPFYDRWGDSFNVTTEFVVVNQARGFAAAAMLMAASPLKDQPWRPEPAEIEGEQNEEGRTEFRLKSSQLDVSDAQVVWEGEGVAPRLSQDVEVEGAAGWLEAEAVAVDGRRVVGVRR